MYILNGDLAKGIWNEDDWSSVIGVDTFLAWVFKFVGMLHLEYFDLAVSPSELVG